MYKHSIMSDWITPRLYISFYIGNFKPLAILFGCTSWLESYTVGNPEDRFSRKEAHIRLLLCICHEKSVLLYYQRQQQQSSFALSESFNELEALKPETCKICQNILDKM